MSYIKVYKNDINKDFVQVEVHYQFYFYYFLPYVLLSDLKNIDPSAIAVGLFVLNKKQEKIS